MEARSKTYQKEEVEAAEIIKSNEKQTNTKTIITRNNNITTATDTTNIDSSSRSTTSDTTSKRIKTANNSRTTKTKTKRTTSSAVSPEREDMFPIRLQNVSKLVGAHVSIGGGIQNSIINSLAIGANAFALFLRNQRTWKSSPLDSKVITAFREKCIENNYQPNCILPHGSYLINLGNPDKAKREKSYEAFLEDLKRCESLGCSTEQSIIYIAECINQAHQETKNVICVIENMAGSGNVIGSKFKELADIITRIKIEWESVSIHVMRSQRKTYEETMEKFSKIVGFKYLKGMHLNDSLTDLGSNRDRHANIGKGYMGLEPFRLIMNDDRLNGIPLILETPTEQGDEYQKEIELLYELVGKSNLSQVKLPKDFVQGQQVNGNGKRKGGNNNNKKQSTLDFGNKKKKDDSTDED
ncbi:6790_t:CDS:2 [Diversispora eburnea]|uniref:Apurinic-apyrimidinic endonuclease 1 n=1 Tax=Diversispora eburnea TaxID=1213867 RepID=A0A9N9A4I4_9GLOM|nr:6790_t:CDS:2 [Diversispora eburnea]